MAGCAATAAWLRWYHCPDLRTMRRAGQTNTCEYSGSLRKAGGRSLPTHTMVLPLPVMNTDWNALPPSCISLCFSAASSGRVSNAGCSKSLTHSCGEMVPDAVICCSSCNGSAVLRLLRSRALNMAGVESPMGGFTSSNGMSRGTGGATFSTISPLPVQYAAPSEKNTEMSLPMAALHASRSALVAGLPVNSFAAHSVVAALPLPPPRPAPTYAQQC